MTPRITAVVVAGVLAAGAAHLLTHNGVAVSLVLLAAGVVVGELLEIQPPGGPPLPLSYAVVLVVVALASAPAFAATILVAEGVAAVVRTGVHVRTRVLTAMQRCAGAAVAYAAFRIGVDVVGNTPDEFAAQIKAEVAKWGKVIKDANIKVE